MDTQLLATKLFLPPAREGWVKRARLLDRLTQAYLSGSRLSLICAPAGFGKTTLAVDWVNTLRAPAKNTLVAWLSLDSGDDDLTVFLRYLAGAFQTILPDTGKDMLRTLEQSTNRPGYETLLAALINDLARHPEKMALVLDDYHVLEQAEIHQALAFFIERAPSQVHFVITTRQDPLLPLARWRARGQTCEIRLRDLRFSEQESHEFLSSALGDRINPAEIAALSSRTEGWVAGLQLAAISLNQAEISNANFIDSFTGDDRFVMDYLIDEVLSRQSLPVQRFLLNTSVLERISAELCAAVLDEPPDGSDSPRQILEYLERVNLFLIPLDNHREWFRYHHLFAELLQYRLKCEQGGCIPDLKRRAARWFESKNLPEEAIRYAQSAGDWQLSSALICRYSESVLNRSDYMTILRWCGNQPPATLKDNDELAQLYGYALSMTGKLEQGREMLALAQAQQTAHPARLGRTLAYASLNACFRGDFQEEIEQAARALELIPTADHSGRGSAAVSLGLGLFHLGRVAESEKAWREALAEVEHSGAERAHTNVLTYMGRLHILRGEFDQAEESYLLASGLNGLRRNLSNSEMPIFDLAQLKINQNRMEEARELAEKGLEFNRLSGSIEMRSYGFRQMVAVYQVERNWSLAQEWMDKILRLNVEFSQSPLSLSLNAACQVDLALAQGDLRAAERAAPQVTNSLGLYPFIFYPELSRVRLLIELGRTGEAARLLEPVLPRVSQPGWNFPRLQVRLMQALLEKDNLRIRAHLREALELAQPSDIVRPFLDLGSSLLTRLGELRGQMKPAESAFADRILTAAGKQAAAAQPAIPGSELVEPLTEREVEVLRLLADGLSNAEIASRMVLSPNTLKAHTQNIYAKMDVHSRVQAVNRARELKIIE